MSDSVSLPLGAMEDVRRENEKRARRGEPLGVFVLTFGCQQNEADSEKLLGLASMMGYRPVETPEEAALLLVNTCAVREHAEKKVLSIIGGLQHHKKKNGALIGVVGCMAAEEHRLEELKKSYPYVDVTLDPASLARLPEAIAKRLSGGGRSFLRTEEATLAEGIPPCRRDSRRASVSIMYGCNNFCSYCIVPYTRGRERSRSAEAILSEVRALAEGGAREILLLGQNVNSYAGECDFATLLSRLARVDGDFIIRFMTSHPKDVSDRLIEVIGREEKIAPAFHLPLQSGSDRILRAMNRRYDTARYLATVDKLRAARPGIVLTSDIIVGFPGETEEDFEATLNVLRTVRYDMVYSFLYSRRRGTPAATMEGYLSEEVRADRMRRLLDLQTSISAEIGKTYEGRTLRVLVDGPSKNPELYSGRTEGGKLVHLKATPADVGEWKTVHIDRADAYAMYGTVKESEDTK
ncbi:MAG: tRNA (N6-isopentenyl adenosine(37)-C2)-methylthiotransferase MiaB [Clostridia bacterium]|nr:tRNA (N6-isopentenyl adenosine(37)-C2)-methylthiotransferase MiaB [Clostridia bacterium]